MSKRPRRQQSNERFRMLGFFGMLIFLVIVLVLIWNQLPYGRDVGSISNPPGPQQEEPLNQEVMTERLCEVNGGRWIDAQCLCGGVSRWTCPKLFQCAGVAPQPEAEDLIGVCRPYEEKIDVVPPVEEPSTSQARPQPPGTVCDQTNSICVSEKYQNSLLASPFVVTGTAIAFENQFAWKLLDAKGETIGEGHLTADAPDTGKPGLFTLRSFMVAVPKTSTGTLVLFEPSPRDGEPIHILNIPVRLPRESMAVKYYGFWPNVGFGDPPGTVYSCDEKVVEYSERIVHTSLPIEASIHNLLKLRVQGNRGSGLLFQAIPEYTELVDISLKQGVLNLTFSEELERKVDYPCSYSGLIRDQITRTAKQFPSVKSVIISVEGKTPEETLKR